MLKRDTIAVSKVKQVPPIASWNEPSSMLMTAIPSQWSELHIDWTGNYFLPRTFYSKPKFAAGINDHRKNKMHESKEKVKLVVLGTLSILNLLYHGRLSMVFLSFSYGSGVNWKLQPVLLQKHLKRFTVSVRLSRSKNFNLAMLLKIYREFCVLCF